MVKSNSTHDLINLNTAAPNVTMIPPSLHEAFSLAGVYGDNMTLSSYANFAWQHPWWPNNLLSSPAVRALAPTNGTNESHPSTNISNTQISNLGMNGSQSTLPLTSHLGLSSYNNYLTPNFGSLLTPQINSVDSSNHISNNVDSSTMLNTSGTDLFSQSSTPNHNVGGSTSGGRIKTVIPSKSPRYSISRSSAASSRNCECPNCVDLAQRGLTVDKKNEKHSCHIPGCLKVYGKSSHLKAHLRWHNSSRPSVYQQNRRNGELSHSIQSAG